MTKHVIAEDFELYTIKTFKDQWRFTSTSSITQQDPDAELPGLLIRGSKNHVFFDGTINCLPNGPGAIAISGSQNTLEIGKNANIVGGISTWFDNPEALTLINRGTIGAGGIDGTGKNDRLTNYGHLNGAVNLGAGDDTFIFKGGTLTAAIAGGTGNDILVTNEGSVFLTESADGHFDTVKSSDDYILSVNVEVLILTGAKHLEGIANEGFNLLVGNKGNNVLSALGGNDELSGGKGNDTLSGGAGRDIYFFGSRDGKDRYVDFEPMSDHLDLSDWNEIKNFASLKKHASDHGDDVWVVAGSDRVIIEGISKAELDADWFLF